MNDEHLRVEPDRDIPFLRKAWDAVPSVVRRPIVWSMRSERVRLKVLSRLGIRDEEAFFPLSNGGAAAIDASFARLKEDGVVGDYYEFGLYRGYTFWYAQGAADRAGLTTTRLFGFDSFEGLPEVEGNDKRVGIFISGDYRCSIEDVRERVSEHGFDWDRAALIPGFFDDSLTEAVKEQQAMGPAALVMIDCDLYQSTVPVLRFVADRLQPGTILLFDDWYCFNESPEHGEPRAFREFLEAHPEWTAEPFLRFPTYGQGFVMHPAPS